MAVPRNAVASAAARASVSDSGGVAGCRRTWGHPGRSGPARGHVSPSSPGRKRRRRARPAPSGTPAGARATLSRGGRHEDHPPRHPAKRFSRSVRGYDREEVEAFLSLAASGAFEDLVKELHGLREDVQRKDDEIAAHRGRERALQETLVTAQRASDEDPRVGPQGGRDHHRRGRAAGREDRAGRPPALRPHRRRHPGDEAAACPVRGLGARPGRGARQDARHLPRAGPGGPGRVPGRPEEGSARSDRAPGSVGLGPAPRPFPTSTSSGTLSSAAPSMASRRGSASRLGVAPPPPPAPARRAPGGAGGASTRAWSIRAVHADHGELDEVGRRALDGRVDARSAPRMPALAAFSRRMSGTSRRRPRRVVGLVPRPRDGVDP